MNVDRISIYVSTDILRNASIYQMTYGTNTFVLSKHICHLELGLGEFNF